METGALVGVLTMGNGGEGGLVVSGWEVGKEVDGELELSLLDCVVELNGGDGWSGDDWDSRKTTKTMIPRTRTVIATPHRILRRVSPALHLLV